MVDLPERLVNISRYEPLLMYLLGPDITDLEARILALVFQLGGYTNMSSIIQILGVSQSTVSLNVAKLVEQGYIRKNAELMPMTLVLLLNAVDLRKRLSEMVSGQESAYNFFERVAGVEKKEVLKDTILRAFQVLYPGMGCLPEILTQLYTNGLLSRFELLNNIGFDKKNPKHIRFFDETVNRYTDVIQTFYRKYRKNDMYYRHKIPLHMLAKNRFNYLQLLSDYFSNLLAKLEDYTAMDYNSLIPHQLLNYPSDMRLRLNSCLKHYSTIRILDNGVFTQHGDNNDILSLIASSEEFTGEHDILLLANKPVKIPSNVDNSQIKQVILSKDISYDFKVRDFVLFDENGCLVIPPRPNGVPYYNVTPRFIKTVTKVFNSA
ncbi:MAG: helix-turn-helix transcriptional regulator [Candidatus Odinarchaeota archaeon]